MHYGYNNIDFKIDWDEPIDINSDFRFDPPANIEELINNFEQNSNSLLSDIEQHKISKFINRCVIRLIMSYATSYPYDKTKTLNKNVSLIFDSLRTDKPQIFLPYNLLHIPTQTTEDYFKSVIEFAIQYRSTSDDISQQLIYENLGGNLSSSPCASSNTNGDIDVFARSNTLTLLYRTYKAGSWFPFSNLNGTLATSPSSVSLINNKKIVFFLAPNYSLVSKEFDGTNWGAFRNLSGVFSSSPAATSANQSRVDLFVRGSDGTLQHSFKKGSVWSPFKSLGGKLLASPAVTSSLPNIINIFVRGLDNMIYHKKGNISNNTWSQWINIGGGLFSDLGVTSKSNGTIDLFCRSKNNFLVHNYFDGVKWSGYNILNKAISSAPAPTGYNNHLSIFSTNTNGQLIRYYTGK